VAQKVSEDAMDADLFGRTKRLGKTNFCHANHPAGIHDQDEPSSSGVSDQSESSSASVVNRFARTRL
jgi:hypothetical protein